MFSLFAGPSRRLSRGPVGAAEESRKERRRFKPVQNVWCKRWSIEKDAADIPTGISSVVRVGRSLS
jgi:hypothetical protein